MTDIRLAHVTAAVDAAVASATTDTTAPRDERVTFGRDELAEVARLFKAEATRRQTYKAVTDRLSRALDDAAVKYPSAEVPNLAWGASVEWHDAMAAAWLRTRLERIAAVTYEDRGDGTVTVRARELLGDDFL